MIKNANARDQCRHWSLDNIVQKHILFFQKTEFLIFSH